MLDRLVGPDRAAEREPLLRVLERHLETGLDRADGLRRQQRLPDVPGARDLLDRDVERGRRGRRERHVAQPPRRVVAEDLLDRGVGGLDHDHHRRAVLRSRRRRTGRRPARRRSTPPRRSPTSRRRSERARGSCPATPSTVHSVSRSPGGSAPTKAARLVPAATSWIAGCDPRSSSADAGRCPRSSMPASRRPTSCSTSIASKSPSPAPPFSSLTSRPDQPASTAVCQRSGRVAAVQRLARGLDRLRARDRVLRGIAQEDLLVAELEVHRAAASFSLARSSLNGMPLSSRGSGGSPSTRSPIVLRRISSVPPADFRPGRKDVW